MERGEGISCVVILFHFRFSAISLFMFTLFSLSVPFASYLLAKVCRDGRKVSERDFGGVEALWCESSRGIRFALVGVVLLSFLFFLFS